MKQIDTVKAATARLEACRGFRQHRVPNLKLDGLGIDGDPPCAKFDAWNKVPSDEAKGTLLQSHRPSCSNITALLASYRCPKSSDVVKVTVS